MIRSANRLLDDAAEEAHITLTRIVNTLEKAYGFGITDDGAEVYIPGNMVITHNMKPEEAAARAGLTAKVVLNDRYEQDSSQPQFVLQPPVMWDGEITDNAGARQKINEIHAALDDLEKFIFEGG